MKGVLLVNRGGPQSSKEVESFLYNMFSDKSILPLPIGVRHVAAKLIAKKRSASSWQKYALMKGSPLFKHTDSVAKALELVLDMPVYSAFSYSSPFIGEVMKVMMNNGISAIQVLTMYPQASDSTTSSVFRTVTRAAKELRHLTIRKICDYSVHPQFLDYWKTLIESHLETHSADKPLLLFSAHSIPMYGVRHGDKYPDTVRHMAKRLADILSMNYDVAFQSKLGPVKWVGPDIGEQIEKHIKNGVRKIILVPLSFTCECLETYYDLDIKIVNKYIADTRVDHISRIKIPLAHPLFIETLKRVINE